MDSAPGREVLEFEFAELVAAPGAMVIFELDEGSILSDGSINAGHVELSIGDALGGSGQFENRGNFLWSDGQLGISGEIQFVNAGFAELMISNSGNLLSGHLNNYGRVLGGLRMAADSTIDNRPIGSWNLRPGDSIGVTDPVNPGVFNNSGVLSLLSASQSESRIAARLNNTGQVNVFEQAILRITGPVDQIENGVLSGGTWLVDNGATLIFPESFDTIGPGTVVRGLQQISESEEVAQILGAAIVTGEFTSNGNLDIFGGGRITFDGQSSTTILGGMTNGGAGAHSSITQMNEEVLGVDSSPTPPDQRVTADSGVSKQSTPLALTGTPLLTTPLFDNHAILAPGGLGLPGPFNLDGELVMHPGATLDIDIAGATPIVEHDQLAVTGPITLDGMVQISVAEGFFPAVGQQFVVTTAGQGIGGMLDGVVNANREDIVWSITETADEVIVEVVDVERIFANGFEN